jgi:hypothetical protein
MWYDKVSLNNQLSHMDCLLCHQDHNEEIDTMRSAIIARSEI